MARRDALLRLHQSLLARRDDLRAKLAGELAHLRDFHGADTSGDSADVAFETGSSDMASQLAEFDSRDLTQIEKALDRLKQGSYGVCETCNCKIPIVRLNALPYTTLCIKCQREMEMYGSGYEGNRYNNWEKVIDSERPFEDRKELKLSDLELDFSTR